MFKTFYSVYPRKKEPLEAEKAFKQMMAKGYDPQKMIEGARKFAAECHAEGRDTKFMPYPASWLRAGGFLEYDQETIVPAKSECLMRKVRDLDELKEVLKASHSGAIPPNLAIEINRAKSLDDVSEVLRNRLVPNLPGNVVTMRRA